MDDSTYLRFKKAKHSDDIEIMEKIYRDHQNDKVIKFTYAKQLLKRKRNKEARILLESIITDKFVIFELGKLEFSEGNIDKAREYFEQILDIVDDKYTILELGKLEIAAGNIDKARKLLESLLNTSSREYALFELGRLEYNS